MASLSRMSECWLVQREWYGFGVNLTGWAKAQVLHSQAAYRWFRGGTLRVPAQSVGPRTILVNVEATAVPEVVGGVGLVGDVVEVLTSLCAGLYGRRSVRSRAWKALEAAEHG